MHRGVLRIDEPEAPPLEGGAEHLKREVARPLVNVVGALAHSPLLTEQLVDDLDSVNRLSDPEAADLLIVLLDLLGAFAREDQVDPLVGLLAASPPIVVSTPCVFPELEPSAVE